MFIYDKYEHVGIHVVLNRDMLAFLLCINMGMLDLIILTQITPHKFIVTYVYMVSLAHQTILPFIVSQFKNTFMNSIISLIRDNFSYLTIQYT